MVNPALRLGLENPNRYPNPYHNHYPNAYPNPNTNLTLTLTLTLSLRLNANLIRGVLLLPIGVLYRQAADLDPNPAEWRYSVCPRRGVQIGPRGGEG